METPKKNIGHNNWKSFWTCILNIVLLIMFLWSNEMISQGTTDNYIKTYQPLVGYTIEEFMDVIPDTDLQTSLTFNTNITPSSHTTFRAKEEITLSDGFDAFSSSNSVDLKIVSTDLKTSVLENISYMDGLGTPIQNISRGQSPNGYDILEFSLYDEFGRKYRSYLPAPTHQNTGNIIVQPNNTGIVWNYYFNEYGDGYAFSATAFDGSPLNRPLERSSPGADWQIIPGSDNDHTIKFEYDTNSLTNEIIKFTIDDSGSSPVVNKGAYAVYELYKNTTKNENWQTSDGLLNTVETYTNKNGLVIGKVTYEEVSGVAEKRITQNVYDIFGRLRFVLPPKSLSGVTTSPGTYTIDDNLVYQYEYDEYNRQIAQRVPGSDWEYMVYDQLDRPIFTQDANLKLNNQWLFTKYDALGRPIYSGIYSSSKSRSQLQTEVDNYIDSNADNKSNVEKRSPATTTIGGIAIYYTNDAFPVNDISELLTVNYYDNYNFVDIAKPVTPTVISAQPVTDRLQGLRTASFSKVIGQSTWNKFFYYYDERGRNVRIHQKNSLGGQTMIDNVLDFRGKVDLVYTNHRRDGSSQDLNILDYFTYDYAERVLSHHQRIVGQSLERIADYEYDELGMLKRKKVGNPTSNSTPLQELVYTYSTRGHLTQLNDVASLGTKLFAFKLNYNSTAEGSSTAPARYDGSISQAIWRSAYDDTKRSYAYNYDKLNRIVSSKYQFNNNLNGNTTSHFNTQVAYDGNGNIKTLSRNGTGAVIDQLVYDYGTSDGNQLLFVSDSGPTTGFVDGNTSGNDYNYDGNGNMTKDLNKGVTAISYNHLDRVSTVSLPNNRSVAFIYDASGSKLEKKYLNGTTTISTTDYLGGFQYQDGDLEFFPTPEGYVYKSGSDYKYMYLYVDHLGNNRVGYSDVNGNGIIESSELTSNYDYYPFGGIHSGAYVDALASGYKYTFQGKEYQDEDALNWHDFGSRMYEASLGRWMAKDPQNQFGSPYLALANNPANYVDPDGEFAIAPIIIGATLGGTLGAIQSDMAGGSLIDGAWRGVLTGAFGGFAGQVVSGGSFFASVASGVGTGGATGAFGAALNGNNIFEGAFRGGLYGGVTATISSSIEGFQNLFEYGHFGTHDGTLKHLYSGAQEAVNNLENATMDFSPEYDALEKTAETKMQQTLDYFTRRYGGLPMSASTGVLDKGNMTTFEGITIGRSEFSISNNVDQLKNTIIHEQGHWFQDLIFDENGLGVGWDSDLIPKNYKVFGGDGPYGYGEAIFRSGKFRIPRSTFFDQNYPYVYDSWVGYKGYFGKSLFSRFIYNIPRRGHLFGFRLYLAGGN